MEEAKRSVRMGLKEHKGLLQGLALLLILALPFLLRVLVQANQNLLVELGIGLMALVMIVLIIIG